MKCFSFGIVFFCGPAHLILRNAEVIWCPFQRRSSTAGHICPCVNSLPLLALCPCGLRHGRCVYRLGDQHVSLWPWPPPPNSSSASCLEQAVLRTTTFRGLMLGENMWQYPLLAWRARGTSFLWQTSPLPISFIVLSLLKSLWLNSPHQVLCLIKRSNRISLFFNLFIVAPVGRLKLWYYKHQSWSLCVQKWTLT